MPVLCINMYGGHVKVSQAKKGFRYKELRSLDYGTPSSVTESVWLESDPCFYLGF